MKTDLRKNLETLSRNINLSVDELREIRDNYREYEEEVEKLVGQITRFSELKDELSGISTKIARLNYENYETYMAVHTNSIAISGHRAAIRISGQRLSKELEEDLEELLDKYLMMKF